MGNSTSTVKRRHGHKHKHSGSSGHMHSGHRHTKRCYHNRKSRGGARTMTNRTYETSVPFIPYDEVPTRRERVYEAPEQLYENASPIYENNTNVSGSYANERSPIARVMTQRRKSSPVRQLSSVRPKSAVSSETKKNKQNKSKPKTTKKKKVVRFIKKIFRRKPKSLHRQRLLSLGSRSKDVSV